MAFKYCLFHRDSPVWTTELGGVLLDWIRRGTTDAVIFQNAHLLLDILIRGRGYGIDSISGENVAVVLSNREFCGMSLGNGYIKRDPIPNAAQPDSGSTIFDSAGRS